MNWRFFLAVMVPSIVFLSACSQSPNDLRALYEDAVKAQQAGQMADAQRLFERARAEAIRQGDEIVLADVCNNLGVCYMSERTSKSEAEAKRLFKQALSLWTVNQISDSPGLAYCLNNLGTLSLAHNEFLAARNYLLSSYEIRRKVVGDKNPALILCCHNLGILEWKTGNPRRCEIWFNRALSLAEACFGSASSQADEQREALVLLAKEKESATHSKMTARVDKTN